MQAREIIYVKQPYETINTGSIKPQQLAELAQRGRNSCNSPDPWKEAVVGLNMKYPGTTTDPRETKMHIERSTGLKRGPRTTNPKYPEPVVIPFKDYSLSSYTWKKPKHSKRPPKNWRVAVLGKPPAEIVQYLLDKHDAYFLSGEQNQKDIPYDFIVIGRGKRYTSDDILRWPGSTGKVIYFAPLNNPITFSRLKNDGVTLVRQEEDLSSIVQGAVGRRIAERHSKGLPVGKKGFYDTVKMTLEQK